MIRDIAHVCVLTPDLGAADRFYCEGLGCRKAFEFVRRGQVVGFYLEVARGRYVEVFHRDDVQYHDNQSVQHLCFEVDDIDEVCRQLKARGIEVTEKKLGADQSWQAWVQGPGGVRIEFHQYTRASSQVTGANCILG